MDTNIRSRAQKRDVSLPGGTTEGDIAEQERSDFRWGAAVENVRNRKVFIVPEADASQPVFKHCLRGALCVAVKPG